jgi:chromatin assembly factor 1 subunit A
VATDVPSQSQQSRAAAFAVPPLPQHRAPPPTLDNVTNAPPKKPTTIPKTPFPDTLVPALAAIIARLEAPNLSFLIESAYHDPALRTQKVKKIAIEAKIKEIAEKDAFKKVWVVKSNVSVV